MPGSRGWGLELTSWRRRVLLTVVVVQVAVGAFGLGSIQPRNAIRQQQLSAIEAFVQRARGLPMHQRPKAEFLSDAAFSRALTGDLPVAVAAARRHTVTPFDDISHALGLLRPAQNEVAEFDKLRSNDALGFYNTNTNAIVIRSHDNRLTVGVRVALSHELTHALQRQNLPLAAMGTGNGNDYGAVEVDHALVEGDATRILLRYVAALSAQDHRDYDTEENALARHTPIGGVAPAIRQRVIADYVLGTPMTSLMALHGGNAGVDDAFRHPPASDIAELNPFALLDNRAPGDPATPPLLASKNVREHGHLGAVMLYLLLASHLDPSTAVTAADGWAGDSFVTYAGDTDSRPCIAVAFAGVDDASTRTLAGALGRWRDALPAGTATVTTAGRTVRVDACQPAKPTAFTPRYVKAINYVAMRYALVVDALAHGDSRATAECLSRAYLASLNAATPVYRRVVQTVSTGPTLRSKFAASCR